MSETFISYRRSDSQDVAGRTYDRLTAHFSRDRVFKDVDSIPLSVPFATYLQEAFQEARAVVVIIGPTWLTSKTPIRERSADRAESTTLGG